MSIWTRAINYQLRKMGSVWEATIDGECQQFYGIFDAENRLQEDGSGMQVLIAGSVLTVNSDIAKHFGFNHQLKDERGTVWYCREVLKVDDGALSRCTLTEKPE